MNLSEVEISTLYDGDKVYIQGSYRGLFTRRAARSTEEHDIKEAQFWVIEDLRSMAFDLDSEVWK